MTHDAHSRGRSEQMRKVSLQSVHNGDMDAFKVTLKAEIERLKVDQLPLQQALRRGGYALEGSVEAMILKVAQRDGRIQVWVGLFYRSVIAGCNCADDPTPVEPVSEYCEVQFDIDRATGAATVALVDA